MSKILRLAVVSAIAFVVMGASARAQNASDFQTWSAALSTVKLTHGKVPAKAWFDGHVRRGGSGTVLIARPGLGLTLAPGVSVWAGYAWVPSLPGTGDARIDEHRAWQQVILSRAFAGGKVKLQARTRFEQRVHQAGSRVGLRLREFVRLDLRPRPSASWGLVAWDELFVGLNQVSFAPQSYDQNRLFVGGSLQASDALRVEAGYLWVDLRRPPIRLTQHALVLNFFVSL